MKLLEIINVGSGVIDKLLIRFFISVRYCKKWEYNETLLQLFMDFKKAYDSVRREVLYKILIEFGVPMKLVRLIEMCLNETPYRQTFVSWLSYPKRSETSRYSTSITSAFQLCFRISH
jgi:hypothetical protein